MIQSDFGRIRAEIQRYCCGCRPDGNEAGPSARDGGAAGALPMRGRGRGRGRGEGRGRGVRQPIGGPSNPAYGQAFTLSNGDSSSVTAGDSGAGGGATAAGLPESLQSVASFPGISRDAPPKGAAAPLAAVPVVAQPGPSAFDSTITSLRRKPSFLSKTVAKPPLGSGALRKSTLTSVGTNDSGKVSTAASSEFKAHGSLDEATVASAIASKDSLPMNLDFMPNHTSAVPEEDDYDED